jgi:hypothetical protein
MAIETQIIDGTALSTQTIMITPNAPLRKLLVTVLIAFAGTLGIQAARPSDNQAGPEIIRGGIGQVGIITNTDNSEVQRATHANPKEPVVIRGPGIELSPSRTSLPTSAIEDRLNRVEGAVESERREMNGVLRIIGFAAAAICVFGLGLLIIRRKS